MAGHYDGLCQVRVFVFAENMTIIIQNLYQYLSSLVSSNPEVECFHKPVETQNLTASAYVDTDGIEGMDLSSLEMPTVTPEPSCGSDFAYPYFISFFVLCSFLVSLVKFQCKHVF